MGENLKVVWAEFSTLSQTVLMMCMYCIVLITCPHLELKAWLAKVLSARIPFAQCVFISDQVVLRNVTNFYCIIFIFYRQTLFAVLLQLNCNNYSSVVGVWLFKIQFLMLKALAFSHLLISVAITLLDYQNLCQGILKREV